MARGGPQAPLAQTAAPPLPPRRLAPPERPAGALAALDVSSHCTALLAHGLELLASASGASAGLLASDGAEESPGDAALGQQLALFHDAVSKLKACSISHLPTKEYLSCVLNLYHTLVVHRIVIMGAPRNARGFTALHRSSSYEVDGEVVSPVEIDQLLLRARGGHALAPAFGAVGPSLAAQDPRVVLALNTGSQSGIATIPVLTAAALDSHLSSYVADVLAAGVRVHDDSTSGIAAVVTLPKVVEWALPELGASADGSDGSEVLASITRYMPPGLRSEITRLGALAHLSKKPLAVRFAPFEYRCHQVLTRWEPPPG